MDPDKILQFLSENVREWSRVTFYTLVSPGSGAARITSAGQAELRPDEANAANAWLSIQLFTFVFFSILLGLTINSLLPQKVKRPDLLTTTVFIFISWFVSGSLLYVICKILHGKGTFLQTLTTCLQVSSTIYVVTSFFSVVLSTFISSELFNPLLDDILHYFDIGEIDHAYIFFFLGTLLNTIYIPLSLKHIHKFGWGRTIVLAITPLVCIFLSIAVYLTYGIISIAPLGK